MECRTDCTIPAERLKGVVQLIDLKEVYCRMSSAHGIIKERARRFANKGDKNDLSNYRPIANLCCASKIFEKLILKRINEIQDEAGVDLTSEDQHGFKKKKGTSTLQLQVQSILARANDANNFAIMASLNLSAAFDLVNVKLLMKRLKILGLPNDVLILIKIWLTDRSFYASIDGENSVVELPLNALLFTNWHSFYSKRLMTRIQ